MAAIRKACSVRQTVTAKSVSSGPPARPDSSVPMVSAGIGSRIALMKPSRTARSQMMKSTTGPMKGSALTQCDSRGGAEGEAAVGVAQGAAPDDAGVLMTSPLVEHRFDHQARREDALFREQVEELLEVRDVGRRELVVHGVRRQRHLACERTFNG